MRRLTVNTKKASQMEDVEDYEIDGGLANVRPKKVELHLLSTQLIIMVHSLPSTPFTSRVNLIHIAMVKHIGKLIALIARVDTW